MKILIDPGHGGNDPGGGTNKYWKEKDKVLEISLYQYKRLKELKIEVEMTRKSDVYINSKKRVKLVKQSKADICISNHINAGGGEGAETIYSLNSKSKLADMIAEEIKEKGQKIRRVFNRSYSEQRPTVDYYYMHRDTGNVQTVIIEYGFADNQNDTERILSNWKEYAEGVIKALCSYIGKEYVEPIKEIDDNKSNNNWKEELGINALKSLKDKNIIDDIEYWKDQLLEPTPLWLMFELINRLEEYKNA